VSGAANNPAGPICCPEQTALASCRPIIKTEQEDAQGMTGEASVRWTARRKEEIIISLEAGLITIADAQKGYGLSDEELAAWRRDYAARGRPGLHVTKLRQTHRSIKSKVGETAI
jgi:Protein of unknown function (DUF1153)